MKKATKRFLTLLLAVAMVCSLAACGGSSDSGTSSGDSGTSSGDSSSTDGGSGSATSDVNNDTDGNGRADKVVYGSTQDFYFFNHFVNT